MQLGHEPTPHKKKSKKRPLKKSDHKHLYEDAIGIDDDSSIPMQSKRCIICGKTKIVTFYYSEKVEGERFYSILSLEEVKAKYPDLPIVEVTF